MSIKIDHEKSRQLGKTISRRLSACRQAAKLSQDDVAKALGHKGVTQVSLAESGTRIPPADALVAYADLYGASLDFLMGRTDDPFPEPEELSKELAARVVAQSIQGCFEQFSRAVSQHVGICLSGQREDRSDLMAALGVIRDIRGAFDRLAELNGEAWEDLRGGSKLRYLVEQATAIDENFRARVKREEADAAVVERVLEIDAEPPIKQFQLDLGINPEATPAKRRQGALRRTPEALYQ